MKKCHRCGGSLENGYGADMDDDKKLFCYPCCGERDKETMREDGKIGLYLTEKKDTPLTYYEVKNWPGSIVFIPYRVKKSWHNMAGRDGRRDFWFSFEGTDWHGVNIGDQEYSRCKLIRSSR